MSNRTKISRSKFVKPEHELRIITNPLSDSRTRLIKNDDYQAPLTWYSLSPNSKWILVRNNLHKIRSWRGIDTSNIEPKFRDWYLFFQMRRELKRAQEHIKEVNEKAETSPVKYFRLPIAPNKVHKFNVAHVKPTDAVYYPGLGHEPIILQSLLYYFSNECAVPYESIYRSFLTDVCSIVYRDRQRLQRVAVFRKIALILTILVFIIIGFMFCSLIVSVLTTAANLTSIYKDGVDDEFNWHQSPVLTANTKHL